MLGRAGSWVGNSVASLGLGRVWLYQDFVAGSGPGITLSDNDNGTGLIFDSAMVVDGSAVVTKDTGQPIFTNTAELPSQLVSVSAHTGTSVTLDSTPAFGEGAVRVWYLYAMAMVDFPSDAEVAPHFVKESRSQFLDTRFLNADLNLSDLANATTARTSLGFSSQTSGRVLIGDGGTTFTSSASLFWDEGNKRLGVNQGTPGAGATLDVGGVTGGIGFPVLTTTERDAITPARNGVVVYNSTLSRFDGYIGGSWGPVGITAHSGLSGLTSGDDHTQYFLLAGRSGGQIAYGGTGSGDDLQFDSTSHATKGYISFGALGSLTPNNPIHLLLPNSSSLTNGLVISENSSSWPATVNAAGPQGFQFLPKDNGGTAVIKVVGANNNSMLKHVNGSDGTYTGYFSMGLPWGFSNANAGITTFKVTGTTGQSVDLVQYSNQSDFAATVSSIGSGGQFRAPVGTLALPGQSFHTDTNTGLYGAAADTIGFSFGGVEGGRWAISTGLVLGLAGTTTGKIGISGSTSGVVTITAAAAAGTYTLVVPSAQGGANEAMINDGSGNLSWSRVPIFKADGNVALTSGTTSKAITFATTFGSTNYAISAMLVNTVDADPIHVPLLVIAKAATGFTVEWQDALPTANYTLDWSIKGEYDP